MTTAMRQVAHVLIAVAFWALLVVLWVKLWLDKEATPAALRDTLFQLAVVIGTVLAITTWWVRHNLGIYRRKGPRRGRAAEQPRTSEDRLGRPVRWAMEGGVQAARTQLHLIVELDHDVKSYR